MLLPAPVNNVIGTLTILTKKGSTTIYAASTTIAPRPFPLYEEEPHLQSLEPTIIENSPMDSIGNLNT